MWNVKLTPAQRNAVEIYVTDPAHAEDYPEAQLHGSVLSLDSGFDRAALILIEAANSADVGDGHTADKGSRKALEGVYAKLRKQVVR
jgi:hypothetical protein